MTDKLQYGLVSIIIPFYNRVELTIRSIKSVEDQSYRNWELILVNDGSTDDISDIKSYIASDERIRLIQYQPNKGLSNALNTGLDAVTGDYIAFLDSDDTWNPLKLEKQLNFMHDNNYNASHTNYIRIATDGKKTETIDLTNIDGGLFKHFRHSCIIATPCVIVKREFWGDQRFPLGIDYGLDIITWMEFECRGEWGLLPEVLANIYIGEGSVFQNKYKQQLGAIEILRYALRKPEWIVYQDDIGVMVHWFATLFPNPSVSVPRPGIFRRLLWSLKANGLFGTLKKIISKIRRNENKVK